MAEKETLAMDTNEIKLATNATAGSAVEEEKKKELFRFLRLLKELWEKIRGGKGSIIQQKLEQKLEQLTEAVERNEISTETLKDLVTVVKELDGKLDTLKPEDYEKAIDEFNRDIERVMKDIAEKYVQVDGKFTDKMREALLLKAKSNPELFTDEMIALINSEEFEKDFLRRANVLDSELLAKNQLIIDYCGVSFVTEAKFEEVEGKKTKLIVTVKDNVDAEGIIQKEGYLLPSSTSPYNAQTELFSAFCESKGYHYAPDRSKGLDNAKQRSAKEQFAREFSQGKERDGVESIIYEDSFIVRNAKTSDTLRVSTEGDKITITYFPNATSITATDGNHSQIAQFESEKGKIKFNLTVSKEDANARDEIVQLMLCPEMQQYLEVNGVSKETLEVALAPDANFVGEVSDKKGTEKIKSLYKDMEKLGFDDTKYSLYSHIQKDAPSHINILNKENNSVISFSFDADGNPSTVNYRSGAKGSKFENVFNIKESRATPAYAKNEMLHRDSFPEMFGVISKVMYDLNIERGASVDNIRDISEMKKGRGGEER